MSPDTKRALVRVLSDDMPTTATRHPGDGVHAAPCHVTGAGVLGERTKLDLPLPGLPLSLAGGLEAD